MNERTNDGYDGDDDYVIGNFFPGILYLALLIPH